MPRNAVPEFVYSPLSLSSAANAPADYYFHPPTAGCPIPSGRALGGGGGKADLDIGPHPDRCPTPKSGLGWLCWPSHISDLPLVSIAGVADEHVVIVGEQKGIREESLHTPKHSPISCKQCSQV